MRSPTDASLPPLRATAHGSGSMRIATPSSCRTSTDYSLPVSPAHCERLCTLPRMAKPVKIWDAFLSLTAEDEFLIKFTHAQLGAGVLANLCT